MFFCWIGKVVIVKNEGKINFGNAKIISPSEITTEISGPGESTEEETAATSVKRSRKKAKPAPFRVAFPAMNVVRNNRAKKRRVRLR
ncbi:hypothetical protein [Paenibacillus harenae]|uniref:Uncharacterized protein n=1 Tax=Paenibacillus harenae TaxID=306543 RepID=A0ABT9U1K1_PAEHA|nr:hypothetical protein [Paenibacillus harenae]MDQ0060284.1 hypothetical protein [Paenibacillus harenae]MDQ0112179.1 hypothetical protein [Paenibacillus harenae]